MRASIQTSQTKEIRHVPAKGQCTPGLKREYRDCKTLLKQDSVLKAVF